MERKIVEVLKGKRFEVPPVWLMRQAGRYLPEYRATRKKAGSFLDLCYTPELAEEVTLQPIRRFGFDGSILFSDILVVPDAMGRKVDFVESRGPVLEPIEVSEIARFVQRNTNSDEAMSHLAPVFETVTRLRKSLPTETTLLGFCGAPWTVATYIIAGHGTNDQAPARIFAHQYPDQMKMLLDSIASVSADYLIAQLKHGADAVQIFDSWAGVLSEDQFARWCVDPVLNIVNKVRAVIPDAKIIGFPKGAGYLYEGYAKKTKVDMIGLDWSVPMSVAKSLQKDVPIQGKLDPTLMVVGGDALDRGVDEIVEQLADGPLVFNLGHGITPEAPIGNVERLLKRLRG